MGYVSGRLHRRGDVILYSRSPLFSVFDFSVFDFSVSFKNVGEIHRRGVSSCNSRSPLSEPDEFVFFRVYSCRGEYTGELLF